MARNSDDCTLTYQTRVNEAKGLPSYAEEDYLEGKEDNPQPGSNDDDEEESDSDPEGLTSGSPTPEPIASSLEDAIETAPVAQLQSLLTFICQKNEVARQIASSRLLAPLESAVGQKRKAFEKCKNCDEEYNVLQNEKGVCEYHPGTSLYYRT